MSVEFDIQEQAKSLSEHVKLCISRYSTIRGIIFTGKVDKDSLEKWINEYKELDDNSGSSIAEELEKRLANEKLVEVNAICDDRGYLGMFVNDIMQIAQTDKAKLDVNTPCLLSTGHIEDHIQTAFRTEIKLPFDIFVTHLFFSITKKNNNSA